MAEERISYKVDQDIKPESNDLLRIIHKGIDEIIVNLKRAVDAKGDGTDGTIGKTNDAVVKILDVFKQFQNGVVLGSPSYQMTEPDRTTQLKPNKFGNTKAEVELASGLLQHHSQKAQNILPTDKIEADILDKQTNIDYNTSYERNGYSKPYKITNINQAPLTTRLRNCTQLELLYLNKHNEIIKIFAFVVDLFDKYKYAIKVILFLLKNLVRAEQGDVPPGSVNVRLPKPIITNINLLLKDQENIQTIIKGMEKVVNTTHTNISEGVDTTPIQTSLDAQGSPPDIAQQPEQVAP